MENKNMTIAHHGNGKVIPLNEEEKKLYDVLEKLPRPTASMNLTADQKKWWLWFGKEFISTKQFSKVDLIHLQEAAFWMDARCKMYEEINKKGVAGFVQVFKTGATNITGYLSAVEKADKHLADVSAHFGLSIRDRQKLKKTEAIPSGQLDIFDTIMNMKKAVQ